MMMLAALIISLPLFGIGMELNLIRKAIEKQNKP